MQAFISYAGNGIVIPSVVLIRRQKPHKDNLMRIPVNLCCDIPFPTIRSGVLKAFVKYDKRGNVVPSSLIIRRNRPKISNTYTWKEVPYTMCCSIVTPITITTQPASQTVTATEPTTPVTFTVAATGDDITYQWQLNGTNIVGATNSSYTTTDTTIDNNGDVYTVILTNAAGSVTSNDAVLTVTSEA